MSSENMIKESELFVMSPDLLDLDKMQTCVSKAYDDPVYKQCLLSPYEMKDIEKFQDTHHLVLPPLMTYYLTHISKGFIITNDLEVFKLETWEKEKEEDEEFRIGNCMHFPYEYDNSLGSSLSEGDYRKIHIMEKYGLHETVNSGGSSKLNKRNKWKTMDLGFYYCYTRAVLPVHPYKMATNVLVLEDSSLVVAVPIMRFLLGHDEHTALSRKKNNPRSIMELRKDKENYENGRYIKSS